MLISCIKTLDKLSVDMADGCFEKIDLPFIKFVWCFPIDSRNKIINKLKEYNSVNVIMY